MARSRVNWPRNVFLIWIAGTKFAGTIFPMLASWAGLQLSAQHQWDTVVIFSSKKAYNFQELCECKNGFKRRTLVNVYEIYIELDRQRFILWKSIFKLARSRVNWLRNVFLIWIAGTKNAGTIFPFLASLGWLCDVTKSSQKGFLSL